MTTKSLPSHQTSQLDDDVICDFTANLIRAGETNASVVRILGSAMGVETSEAAIRRFRRRHELNIPGTEPTYTKIRGDEAEGLCKPSGTVLTDPDRMLRERGLNPLDWYVDSMTVNEWEGLQKGGQNKTKLYQTKFIAKRKRPYTGLMPVRSDGWKAPKLVTKPQRDSELVVICGDQQAPFHDERLHELFCQWLAAHTPDRGVLLGDLGDFPDISRHPDDPENVAHAQECLQSSYDILRDYLYASPCTQWDYLLGNHDERIRQYLVKFAPRLYGLRQVDTDDGPGHAVHDMAHLLRLDELGINLIDPVGTYENAQVQLSQNLAVRHGWVVRQGSGASALKTLEQTGYSIIVGHTHRQSCVYHTYHEIDGKPRQLMAVEAGCMCRLDCRPDHTGRRFPNYSTLPDWQQGFCTAHIFHDGKFSVELGRYVNDVLLYEGRRYD